MRLIIRILANIGSLLRKENSKLKGHLSIYNYSKSISSTTGGLAFSWFYGMRSIGFSSEYDVAQGYQFTASNHEPTTNMMVKFNLFTHPSYFRDF